MSDGRVVIDAELNIQKFEQGLNTIKDRAQTLGTSFEQTGAKLTGMGRGIASVSAKAAGVGAGMIVAGKKLINAASVQNQAEAKLEEIYKTRMGADAKAAESTKKLASELQKVGVVGDEVTLSGAQQLATFAKMPGTVDKLLPAMDNLLVQQKGYKATAGDATNIANLMGKAMMGQVGALKRCGISFDENQEKILKYGTEEERAAVLAEVITENVGNMNEKFAQTPEGKIQQAKNALGDCAEKAGNALLPVLGNIAEVLSTKLIPKLSKFIEFLSNHQGIATFAVALAGILTVGGALGTVVGILMMGFGNLFTAAGKASTAISKLSESERVLAATQKAAVIYTKLQASCLGRIAGKGMGAVKAVLAFARANMALMASLGVVALIAALAFALYKTGMTADEICAKINDFANIAVQAINKFAEQLPGIIEGLVGTLTTLIPQLMDTFTTQILPALIQGFQAVLDGLVAALPALLQCLIQMVPVLIQAFIMIFTACANALPQVIPAFIQGVIQIIMAIVQALPTLIMALIQALPAILKAIIVAILTIRSEMRNAAIQLIQSLWNGFKEKFPQVIASIFNFAKQLPAKIKAGLGNLAGTAKAWITGLKNAAVAKLQETASSLMAKARAIPGKIKSALGSLVSIGRDFIAGFWNGIKGKFDNMVSNLLGKVSGLKGKIAGVLGIGSPSKVMAELGQWIPAGLAVGIEKNFGMVEDAVTSLGEIPANIKVATPLNAFTGAGAAVGYTGNSQTVNQVINFNQPINTPAQTARMLREEAMYGMARG